MMRNLARLNNAANNIEARKQFVHVCWLAGCYQIESPLLATDPVSVGWRKLDKITLAIIDLINERTSLNPPLGWDNLMTIPPAAEPGAERSE